MTNRYDNAVNFVPAWRQTERSEIPPIAVTGEIARYDDALRVIGGSDEIANPVQRNAGLVIRWLPFTITYLVLAWGVQWALSMSGWFIPLFFAALCCGTYMVMDWQEYRHSRNGLERHKVDTIKEIALEQMDHEHELRRMALDAQIRMMEMMHCERIADTTRRLTSGK